VKKGFLLCILWIYAVPIFSQSRSFDELFPALDQSKRERVFSHEGLVLSSKKTGTLQLSPSSTAGIEIVDSVLKRNPAYLTESLLVIPLTTPRGFIHIYNALGNIQGLKGRLYHSVTRDDDIPLFEEATRIVSAKKLNPIPDPSRSAVVPASETMYIRLKDVNFGNSYYRADITSNQRRLLYTLSNFRSLTYGFIPVMKENKFIAQLYFEIIQEGILVYSIAGADVSDFIASQVDITSAIRKRLQVIIQWVVEGITS
jgi:hypothetical protein